MPAAIIALIAARQDRRPKPWNDPAGPSMEIVKRSGELPFASGWLDTHAGRD